MKLELNDVVRSSSYPENSKKTWRVCNIQKRYFELCKHTNEEGRLIDKNTPSESWEWSRDYSHLILVEKGKISFEF